MEFCLLINVKMPTVIDILTFMSRKNCILGLSEPEKAEFFIFYAYEHLKFELSMENFITSEPGIFYFLLTHSYLKFVKGS